MLLLEQVLAHWCGKQRPKVLPVDLQAVLADAEVLAQDGVAWFALQDAGRSKVFEVVGIAQDRTVPAMLVAEGAGGRDYDGVVACDVSTPTEALCAGLRGLYSQCSALQALAEEAQVSRATQVSTFSRIREIDEELRLAGQLQREYLPRQLPEVEGMSLEVLWQPAGYVSGDIYDVQLLDEEHLGVFMADAVGHGVPAALMTMFIKRSLPTKRIDPSLPNGYAIVEPSEAIARLNRDLVAAQRGKVRFATACYAVIHIPSRTVRFARAGHPYPFIQHEARPTDTLEADGGLLGVFDEEEFKQTTMTLEPGDRLMIYSDGFEMAIPGSEPGKIDTHAFEARFEAMRQDPIDVAFEKLKADLNEQSGSLNQRDDLTLICLGFDAKAQAQTLAA